MLGHEDTWTLVSERAAKKTISAYAISTMMGVLITRGGRTTSDLPPHPWLEDLNADITRKCLGARAPEARAMANAGVENAAVFPRADESDGIDESSCESQHPGLQGLLRLRRDESRTMIQRLT